MIGYHNPLGHGGENGFQSSHFHTQFGCTFRHLFFQLFIKFLQLPRISPDGPVPLGKGVGHAVERIGQHADLIPLGDNDPLAQVAGFNHPRPRRQLAQRPGKLARNDKSENTGEKDADGRRSENVLKLSRRIFFIFLGERDGKGTDKLPLYVFDRREYRF